MSTTRGRPPRTMYLVWTFRGRKYYARADDGFAACSLINAHMSAHGITGDSACNAFPWEDQQVFPIRTQPQKSGVR